MNRTNEPPTFSGYDLSNQTVTDFIKDFNRWIAINDIPMGRKRQILEACLEDPAAQDFAEAILPGGGLHGNLQVVAGDAAAQLAAHNHNWPHIVTWLENTYNGPEQQRLTRAVISSLLQTERESPRQFLIRINTTLRKAGYDNAVIPVIAEQTWLNGISNEVKGHANGFAHLDFEDLVKSCDGFWKSTTNTTRQVEPAYRYNQGLQRELKLAPPKFQYQPRYAQQQYQQEEFQEPRQILQRTERRQRTTQRQQQQQKSEDPDIAQLLEAFQDLKVHFTELKEQIQVPRQPAQRFYQRENYNRRDQLDPQDRYRRDQQNGNNQRRDYQNNQRDFNCFKCGERGHMAKDCQTETNRRAQTPAPSRVNTIEDFEDSDDEEVDYYASDEEFDQVFPVVSEKKKQSSLKPYTKVPKEKKTRRALTPIVEEMLEDSEVPMPEEVGQSESVKEGNLKTNRRTKTYETDSWDLVKDLPTGLTIKQLAELSAVAREQLKRGITGTKPTYSPVNTIDTRSTPAYTTAQIERKIASVIIDTGAGISLISKAMLDRLGWSIDKASTRTLVVADGSKSIALGEMNEVPITFNNLTVPIKMTVIEGDTYDIILGTDWLNKAHAKLDIQAAKMRITYHGVIEIVNLDMTRGIRNQMSNTDSESEEESFAINNIHDKKNKWPKANKPARHSDDDEPSDAQHEQEFQRTGGMDHFVTPLDERQD